VLASDGSDPVETVAIVDAFDEMMVMEQGAGADDTSAGNLLGVDLSEVQSQATSVVLDVNDVVGADDFAAMTLEPAVLATEATFVEAPSADDVGSVADFEAGQLDGEDELLLTSSDFEIDGAPDDNILGADIPDTVYASDIDQVMDDPLDVEDQSLDAFDDSDSMTNDGF